MFFRNLTLFRFPTNHNLSHLGDGLGNCRLKPVGPLEMSSRGFISPFGRDHEELSAQIGNSIWLTVGGEDRLLPGSVVNAELAKKIAEHEEREGRLPGGRTRRRMKDELLVDLLPRAFVKPGRADVIINLDHGIVAVDTSSRKTGENVISEIRRAIGSFPALPLNAEIAPRSILTGWVAGEEMPEGLAIGDECVLQDPVDGGATIKCSRQELESDEIAKHLETGKQVTRLALTYSDRVSFVIGEDLVVRKFKLLDGALDKMDDGETRENLRAELDARFALMSGEVRELFGVLERALKLSKVEA